MAAGSWVAQTCHHSRDELPEWERGIVCYKVSLQGIKRGSRSKKCGQNVARYFHWRRTRSGLVIIMPVSYIPGDNWYANYTFPQIVESLCKFSAAKICPCTTFTTYVKSTMFFPSLQVT